MSTTQFNIRWADIGCPTEPGLYDYEGKSIHVKQVHIDATRGRPEALCTVVVFTPLKGPTTYGLGGIDPDPRY